MKEQDPASDLLGSINLLDPMVFSGLFIGAVLPALFTAMTMKSVGAAAFKMIEEVRRQFRDDPGIMEGTSDPDYAQCVAISTQAAIREMVAPGVLIMGAPLVTGFLFGIQATAGLLAGSLVAGGVLAISASNSGGAWDNAKKFIEAGNLGGKGTDNHKAAVVGDTVGDPLKDTSGPSLNILIKLSAILSLVFVPFFVQVRRHPAEVHVRTTQFGTKKPGHVPGFFYTHTMIAATLIYLALVWGANFIFMKWAVEYITPGQIVLARVVLGFLVVLAYGMATRQFRREHFRYTHHFIAMACLAASFYYYAYLPSALRCCLLASPARSVAPYPSSR